jgi:hypothetical protein
VAVQHLLHDLHPIQDLPLGHLDLAEEFPLVETQNIDPSNGLAGVRDAGTSETQLCLVQRIIQNDHSFGPGIHAGLGDRGNDQGMRGGPSLGWGSEGHVGLEDDSLSFVDETADSSEGLQGLAGRRRRITRDNHEVMIRCGMCRGGSTRQTQGESSGNALEEKPASNLGALAFHSGDLLSARLPLVYEDMMGVSRNLSRT